MRPEKRAATLSVRYPFQSLSHAADRENAANSAYFSRNEREILSTQTRWQRERDSPSECATYPQWIPDIYRKSVLSGMLFSYLYRCRQIR